MAEFDLNANSDSLIKKNMFFYVRRSVIIENMPLVQFIKTYYIKNSKIVKRTSNFQNLAVYFKPSYFNNKKSRFYFKHCMI